MVRTTLAHHLYILYILFYAIHVGVEYMCMIPPGIFLFLIDRHLRFLQSRQNARLLSARILPCDALELNYSKNPCGARRPRFDGNRGNKSSQIDLGFQGRNVAETGRDADQLGDSFLDKFKLGFNDKLGNPSEVEASSQSGEATNSSSSSQPVADSMPQDADEIFKKMKETGFIPNAVAMLDGLCKDGNVQEALKLFGLMREKGTIPEIVIYTAVVEGYTKAHKVDDAIRIFRKMQSNGITPNAFSYTVLVQGLYKCSRQHDAFEFCVEMLEAGHSLNVTTFVGLVDGFCKENGVEEVKGVVKTLTEKGFAFDEKAVREFLDKKASFSGLYYNPTSFQAAMAPFYSYF